MTSERHTTLPDCGCDECNSLRAPCQHGTKVISEVLVCGECGQELAKVLSRASRLELAAKALLADVRRRYPGEELHCEFMRELDDALSTQPVT